MNKNPKPYQITGINFLAANKFALLGDDAGLGKSMQLIKAANKVGADRVLVVCPAVGRVSWRIQFAEWDETRRPVHVITDLAAGIIPDGPVVIIVTVDHLSDKTKAAALRKALDKAQPFDAAFVDEGQYLKTPSANRTRAVYGARLDRAGASILKGVPVVWVASGTFTPLNVTELYTHLKALFPERLAPMFKGRAPTLWEFTMRFARVRQGQHGQIITGNNPDTIPALREAMRPIFLMRRKQDVLTELPPVQPVLLGLNMPAPKKTGFLAPADVVAAMTDEEFLAYVSQLSADAPAYSTARCELGVAKLKAAWPWVSAFAADNPDKKLIVFAHHRVVLEQLFAFANARGLNPVMVHGGTNPADDIKSVDRFQNDLAVRLFVGQTRSAGTSITLTAAHHVLLLEPDPSPVNNYQAISRAHRLGQLDTVFAHFAFAENDPIDKRMATTLHNRATDFEQLFGATLPGATPTKSNKVA